ncbi:MAG: hypothetical protein RR178_03275, partial [Gordonibacter sp.]
YAHIGKAGRQRAYDAIIFGNSFDKEPEDQRRQKIADKPTDAGNSHIARKHIVGNVAKSIAPRSSRAKEYSEDRHEGGNGSKIGKPRYKHHGAEGQGEQKMNAAQKKKLAHAT